MNPTGQNQGKLVRYPDPILRKKCAKVEDMGFVQGAAQIMLMLIGQANVKGLGLAAPQMGFDLRFFVVKDGEQNVFINPEILEASKKTEVQEEGCLSIPYVKAHVNRHKSIKIKATDGDGQEFILEAEDDSARVIQHEMDHLNGVLIIDKLTPMDKVAQKQVLKRYYNIKT